MVTLQHSNQYPPTDSSLWMGLGVFQGTSHSMSLFSSNLSTAHMRVAKLLCDDCTERILVHSHLPGAWGSYGQAPPRIWVSSGQLSHRAQHPGTVHKALIAEHPQPLCWTDLTLSPSAGPEVAASGQVCDLGLHWLWPPSSRFSRGFHSTWALSLSPPTTHPLPDPWVPLIRRRPS